MNGTFLGSGGPSPGVTIGFSGSVRLTSSGHSVTVPLDAAGRFSTTVPPGHWTATALMADGSAQPCAAPQEFEAVDEPVTVRLSCAIP